MPSPSEDAHLTGPPEAFIPALAEIYDKFAHSLEPFSVECDRAEALFVAEIARWYELLPAPKPSLHDFRKAVIVRCKRYLAATDKPQVRGLMRGLDEDP
jgi:hypothetical protein